MPYNPTQMSPELPAEILAIILEKLSQISLIRAGAVCRSWRAAAMEINSSKVRLPLLCLLDEQRSHSEFCSVIDMADNMVYQLHLRSRNDRSISYLGSGDGWLIAVSSNRRESFILNPFSRKRIQLPHRPMMASCSKVILSSSPTSDDCMVVAIYDCDKLSFCKLRNKASFTMFKPFRGPEKPCVDVQPLDIICFNGLVYVVGSRFELVVFELHPRPKLLSCVVLPQNEIRTGCGQFRWVYLVESCGGELLMVLESWLLRINHQYSISNGKMQGFHIFKLNAREKRWVKVESLGDQMLFLSTSSSRAIPTDGLSGFKGNSVCFSNWVGFFVYSLEDNSLQRIFPDNQFRPTLPFIWPPLA